MKVWVVVAESCSECNSRACKVFSHKPSDKEIDEVNLEAGGMWCIGEKVFTGEVDGKMEEEERDD